MADALSAPPAADAEPTGGSAVSSGSQSTSCSDIVPDAVSAAVVEFEELTWRRNLGEGTYAVVEECCFGGKDVAVKRLRDNRFRNKTEVRAFIREGLVLQRLNHPSIVRTLGLGFDAKTDPVLSEHKCLFIVQDLCHGGSLRVRVAAQMAAPNKVLYTYASALRWCHQISAGLAYLHSQRPMVIHRDLKLDNILLTDKTGEAAAIIADFGLMALADSLRKSMDGRNFDLTGQTGSLLTMAPEVVQGLWYNEKADIFSLSCCIYEVFAKTLIAATVKVTQKGECKRFARMVATGVRQALPEDWPPLLQTLVAQGWAQDSKDRPTALEVMASLESPELRKELEEWDRREEALAAGGCCALQ